jgi:hypothetical protein
MNEKIEAIKEAITFIRHNWIGKADLWKGDAIDFVGAVIESEVSHVDIRHLIGAMNDGEPSPIDGLGGTIKNNKLIEVWVTK